jgi:sugar transferase (PEP-CTERM/EpsH1 system associated)
MNARFQTAAPADDATAVSPVSVAGQQLPLIVHIIYRLDVGGLENGLVNLINRMPPDRYRHAIVSLTEVTEFRQRIARDDVTCTALHKREGKDLGVYRRLWKALRALRPQIVHTRNLPALDCQVVAALAGVPGRVHGEHGRDVYDLDGTNWKYNWLRRAVRPLIHRYIPLSRDLDQWLRSRIAVPENRIARIYNGVDSVRFHPAGAAREPLPAPHGFAPPGTLVIGTVGRMAEVKDPLNLVRAFLRLLDTVPDARARLRLVMVGDGPLRAEAGRLLAERDAASLAWLPGSREDVAPILRGLDVFVLPSKAEGISNTILEAMASGLPVVATRVGGNPELVTEGESGLLVPAGSPEALAQAVRRYLDEPGLAQRQGQAARRRIEREFSLDAMVSRYLAVYDAVLAART